MSWRIKVTFSVSLVIVSLIGVTCLERVSSEIKVPSFESVRSWYESVSATTEGGVHNDVERSLREALNFSPDDIDAIRSSTSVTTIYYCQSAFGSTGSLRTTGSWRSESQCESARRARSHGLPHHDFAVVRLTATNSEGELLELYISAEKEGRGQGGGTPGIYINLLTECELQNLQANILIIWDGFSIQVPLDVLTTELFEGHDTDYNLLNKNCWNYAKAACRSVFRLLSQQPGVNPEQKQIFLEIAGEVSIYVATKVIWEAVRGIGVIRGIAGENKYQNNAEESPVRVLTV
ncbi:hypothetical protein AXG93_3786s1010 [Marchantia polymorpha subsp. ruderalis]|uniref:PPPDE domain-containing protein n=1 Tax=Marchantia polymorpha subsp. ruderalis TaxID=1480154 RepID=A0A176W1A6_MARPO|nr:hypothetical protein AXG93_3786s1010 [Marchantia polymorpha subsp. ruderalis]